MPTAMSEQPSSNEQASSALEPTSYVVEGNTYRKLIAERDALKRVASDLNRQLANLRPSESSAPPERASVEPLSLPSEVPSTDELVRDCWRAAGGKFHGPNVETGTMPEAKLLPYLRSLYQQIFDLRTAQPPSDGLLRNLLRHCDTDPEGETAFERDVIAARKYLAGRSTPTKSEVRTPLEDADDAALDSWHGDR